MDKKRDKKRGENGKSWTQDKEQFPTHGAIFNLWSPLMG